jgi:hypothetical protein
MKRKGHPTIPDFSSKRPTSSPKLPTAQPKNAPPPAPVRASAKPQATSSKSGRRGA